MSPVFCFWPPVPAPVTYCGALASVAGSIVLVIVTVMAYDVVPSAFCVASPRLTLKSRYQPILA